uniref:Rho-GAP domain-containing protein n=1 Tax=Clastoptera arizonana TaxID=38151 RepID=A0A1B6CMK9_9HEMI
MLTGSLLMGRRPTVFKTFGVLLEELPVTREEIPRAVARMVLFIENYGLQFEGLFRLSGGNPRLVERMKASMDRTGDADLEGYGDVTSVASLLKLWLRDLPEPLVSPAVTAELVTLLHKYRGEPDWQAEAKIVVAGLPSRNALTLKCVLRLLNLYNARHPDKGYLQPLAAIFSPLLLCGEYHGIATPDTTYLTSKLICDYKYIFSDRLVFV